MALKHAADAREKALGKRGDLNAEDQAILRAVYYTKHLGDARARDILKSLLERDSKGGGGSGKLEPSQAGSGQGASL